MNGSINTSLKTTDCKLVVTGDNSHTLTSPFEHEHYHSIHGAITESKHVFIEAGLANYSNKYPRETIKILEVGFGTGLNALLSANFAIEHQIAIDYTSIEAFPLPLEITNQLNFNQELEADSESIFKLIHSSDWETKQQINSLFELTKLETTLQSFESQIKFNLCYYDAFGPRVQPELWEASIFEKITGLLHPKAILVTYCCKGDVRRALMSVGFKVEKIPGPPGKREMIRAVYEP
jgi:tRNA U34 5-methylaminomethyl-2-thiouridine-forming methyltransferase MnmC